MGVLDRMFSLADEATSLKLAKELFAPVNAKLYLQFRRKPLPQKRKDGQNFVNRLVSGIVTMGGTPSAVPLYDGPTSRSAARKRLDSEASSREPASRLQDPKRS